MNIHTLAAAILLAAAVAPAAMAQGNLPPSSPEQTRQGSMAYPAPLHGNPAPLPTPFTATPPGTATSPTATPPTTPTGVSAPAVPK